MSNLYKQWFVRTETNNARVINSDAKMASCLEKNAVRMQPQQKVEPGAFSEGLFAEEAGNVIKAEPEPDYVQLAQEEAERILAEAKSQAALLVEDAKNEVSELLESAKNQGYQEGKTLLEQELEQLREQLELSYQKKEQELEASYVVKRDNMERELVDVILEVFNKVFHIQFDNKKHILMYLIDDAILGIEGEKNFRIKVAESNVLFLENHKDDIMDRVGHDIELEILADSTMDGNACIIETDSGVFDCSLGVQLENLIKDIRSLCS